MRFGWKGLIVALAVTAAVAATTIALTAGHSSRSVALGPQGHPIPTSPAPSTAPSTVPPQTSPTPAPNKTDLNESKEPGAELEATKVGAVGTVLVDTKGFTLYHLAGESDMMIQCTGGCASVWPPLLAPGGKLPLADPALVHSLGTVKRPDGGVQVTYKGLPLYTYAGDSRPGQANGQGIESFFAVKL